MSYLCNHITKQDWFQAWVLSKALQVLSRAADIFPQNTALNLFREREHDKSKTK